MSDLALAFLLVSCASLAAQALALARLARRKARSPAEKLVGRGYLRTVGCRVLAAGIYVTLAGLQAAGDGTLSPEALAAWTAVQGIWLANSLADIRIRHRIAARGAWQPGRHRHTRTGNGNAA